jgi:predicted secreted protein
VEVLDVRAVSRFKEELAGSEKSDVPDVAVDISGAVTPHALHRRVKRENICVEAACIQLMFGDGRYLGGQWRKSDGPGLLEYREWSARGRYEGSF